jgi:hypothetical protein
MDHRKAYKFLTDFFGSKSPKITIQKRGFMDTYEGEIQYKQVAS